MADQAKHNTNIVKFVNLLATTVGRDKTCRIIQYFSRFLSANINYWMVKDPKQRTVWTGRSVWIMRLSRNMSMTRKALFFGRYIPLIIKIKDQFNALCRSNKSGNPYDKMHDSLYLIMQSLCDFFLILYFFTDHYLFIHNTGLIKKNPARLKQWDFWNNATWFLEMVFLLIAYGIEINLLLKQKKQLESEENIQVEKIKAIKERIKIILIDGFSNFIDLPVPIGLVNDKIVPMGTYGLCATVSSFIGIYQNWK